MGCYIYLSWSVSARMLPPRTGSPCYNISTCQYGSTRGMNFPYISELVLYSSAVTAKFCVAPRYNASICQTCRKEPVATICVPDNCSATTMECTAPCDNVVTSNRRPFGPVSCAAKNNRSCCHSIATAQICSVHWAMPRQVSDYRCPLHAQFEV